MACGTAVADPVEEYRRACKAPHYEVLSVMTHPADPVPIDWAAAAKPCRAFIQRLEETAPGASTAETRLALYLAKTWLGGQGEMDCAEMGEPDALFEWSHCIDDEDARTALTKKAAEMGHAEARSTLISMFEHSGDHYGLLPETLARYAEGRYEGANTVSQRYRAAQALYKLALDAGDRAAASAIQNRLVRDHGLDSLDFTPERRTESLDRACAVHMFALDLEWDVCVPKLEMLAAEAAAAGERIPLDVLLHIEHAFDRFKHGTWSNGPKPAGTGKLAAILAAHPEALRSSEHLRVLANTEAERADRIGGLRRAVDVDPGNLHARCDLAAALVFTGAPDEAASLYKGLAAEHSPCRADAEIVLRRLADGDTGGPTETIILH